MSTQVLQKLLTTRSLCVTGRTASRILDVRTRLLYAGGIKRHQPLCFLTDRKNCAGYSSNPLSHTTSLQKYLGTDSNKRKDSPSSHLLQKRFYVNMAENRYVVCYAKLGTSSCKKCKQKIDKGALRIGKVVSNPFGDDGGDMKQWFHPSCIFETFLRARATTKKIEEPDDMEGFTDLNQEDKDTLNQLIDVQQQMAEMTQMQTQLLQMQMQQMRKPLTAAELCALTQEPFSVECPHCHTTALTTVEKKAGSTNYINAIMISLVGCCCLIPLFWNLHKDTIHSCSNCKQEIGRHIVKTGHTSSRRRRRGRY